MGFLKRHVSTHRHWFKASGILAALVLIGTSYSVYNLAQHSTRMRIREENTRMRLENERQREKLKRLEERVKAIEEESRRLSGREPMPRFSAPAPAPAAPTSSSSSTLNIISLAVMVALSVAIIFILMDSKPQGGTPQLPKSLIRLLSSKEDAENIIGDLQEEVLVIFDTSGPFKARVWLYKQTLFSVFPLIYNRVTRVALRLTESWRRLLIR